MRDFLSADDLAAVQSMERLVSGLVDCGWGYGQVKDFIMQIEREKGIAVRQALTKALQQSAEDERMHGHPTRAD